MGLLRSKPGPAWLSRQPGTCPSTHLPLGSVHAESPAWGSPLLPCVSSWIPALVLPIGKGPCALVQLWSGGHCQHKCGCSDSTQVSPQHVGRMCMVGSRPWGSPQTPCPQQSPSLVLTRGPGDICLPRHTSRTALGWPSPSLPRVATPALKNRDLRESAAKYLMKC